MELAHDLMLAHRRAAAHDVPHGRVLPHGTGALVRVHACEAPPGRARGSKSGAAAEVQTPRHAPRDVDGDRRSAREARRLEAGNVKEAGGVIRLADDEVMSRALGSHAREVRDDAPRARLRPRPARPLENRP